MSLVKLPEIRAAIKRKENDKAPGVDMITAELVKLGEETVEQWLTKLAASVWWLEAVSEDWVKQLTIQLHKNGAHEHCDNFRGIAVQSKSFVVSSRRGLEKEVAILWKRISVSFMYRTGLH